MRQELEKIRHALLSRDALDDEARDALASLEAALDQVVEHPAGERVREVVAGTANSLTEEDDDPGALAATWSDLRGQLTNWEEEYPGLVLAIGRVSNSLATLGL